MCLCTSGATPPSACAASATAEAPVSEEGRAAARDPPRGQEQAGRGRRRRARRGRLRGRGRRALRVRMALKASDNDYHRAAPLNWSRSRPTARSGRLGTPPSASRTKMRVSLQTGKVSINGRSLIPVPGPSSHHDPGGDGVPADVLLGRGEQRGRWWLQIKRVTTAHSSTSSRTRRSRRTA